MSRTAACTFIVLLALVGTAAAVRGPAAATTIDDFEDRDLIAASGSAWVPIGDDLLGGKTSLRLETTRGGSDGSRGALVGVRRGPLAKSVNFMASVTAGNDWSTVEIPFSRLQPQGKGLETERW